MAVGKDRRFFRGDIVIRRFIYFMSSDFNGKTLIKIGMRWRPAQRKLELEKQLGQKITLISVDPVPADDCRYIERELHKRFSADRVRGEWFSVSKELRRLADSLKHNKIEPYPMVKRV